MPKIKTHGQSGTPEYYAWRSMKARCSKPDHPAFRNYGGRGIGYDEHWEEFLNFYQDMGPRPNDQYSLDRLDNEKDYSKANCSWVTAKDQANNMRTNTRIEFQGLNLTLMQWSEKIGVGYSTLWRRIFQYNIPLEKALSPSPLRPWKHGTRAGYENHKCRCNECRESNNQRHRKQRLKRKAKNEL